MATGNARPSPPHAIEPRYLFVDGNADAQAIDNETDLTDLPDDSYRHELVAGVIVAEPLPTHRHDRVRRRIQRRLRNHIEAGELGEVFGEVGLRLGARSRHRPGT